MKVGQRSIRTSPLGYDGSVVGCGSADIINLGYSAYERQTWLVATRLISRAISSWIYGLAPQSNANFRESTLSHSTNRRMGKKQKCEMKAETASADLNNPSNMGPTRGCSVRETSKYLLYRKRCRLADDSADWSVGTYFFLESVPKLRIFMPNSYYYTSE